MERNDLIKLNEFQIQCYEISSERFRFGPSKLYTSNLKVSIKVQLERNIFELNFFVIEGDVPMLLGNDIMEPLGGNLNLLDKVLEFNPILRGGGGAYMPPLPHIGNFLRTYLSEEAPSILKI